MTDQPNISAVAAAIGDPARGQMLAALMDGRARTATELALEAGVAPSTASSHLAKLQQAGLVTRRAQGRHRYFQIATSEVASLLESLACVAVAGRPIRSGPRDEALRRARVCYDHLAGEKGVALLDRMHARQLLRGDGGSLELTVAGETWMSALGIDVDALRRRPRPLVRACLDWSERRDHLAGAAGAAILARLFELRLLSRDPLGRAISLSRRGEAFLATLDPPPGFARDRRIIQRDGAAGATLVPPRRAARRRPPAGRTRE
jgi:DNA-binding transcriptional ArsR family regulator